MGVSPSATPSEPGAKVPRGIHEPHEHKTPWTAYIKPVLWTLLLLYIVLFVFLNRAAIEINFLFFTAQVPLIFVLLGVGLIGALFACAIVAWMRHRSGKKAATAAENDSVKGGGA